MIITRQEQRRIEAMFDRYKELIEKNLIENKIVVKTEMFHASVAENVLRDVVTVVFNKATPFSAVFPVEMAIRIASLMLSTLPIEEQEANVEAFISVFPKAHRDRLMRRLISKTDWENGPGTPAVPNFPDAKDLN